MPLTHFPHGLDIAGLNVVSKFTEHSTRLGGVETGQSDLDTLVGQRTVLSAKEYGAIGLSDQSQDDTSALQTAINAAAIAAVSTGGTIFGGQLFVPPGGYVTGNINMKSRVVLQGAGKGTVFAALDTATGTMFQFGSDTINHTELRDFTINGRGNAIKGIDYTNNQNDQLINAAAIFDVGDPQHRISDLDIYACDAQAVTLLARATQMRNCHIFHCQWGLAANGSDSKFSDLDINWIDRQGVQIGGGNNEITKIKVWYIGIDNTYAEGDGFVITSGRNILLGCQAQDISRHGLRINSGDSNVIEGLMLDNIGNFFLEQGQGFQHPANTMKSAIVLENGANYNKISATLAQRSSESDLQAVVTIDSSDNNYVEIMRNPAHLAAGGVDIHGVSGDAANNVVVINGIRYGVLIATVAASADDGSEVIATGVNNITNTAITIRDLNINAFRFLATSLVGVPSDNIVTARILFSSDSDNAGAIDITFTGEGADASAAFTTGANNITSRADTTASVVWSSVPDWLEGNRGLAQLSPDLSPIAKEIVARAGFDGVLTFFTSGDSANIRKPRTFDRAAADAATLTVVYKL